MMIRFLLLLLLISLLYHAAKTVLRSAVEAYGRDDEAKPRLSGADMVMDPQCRTYVLKDRAVVRRIRGRETCFCSTSCADAFEQSSRT